MGAIDTIRDIAKLASAGTLGKDVIDLLKEKASLLTEQLATLEDQKSRLEMENAQLKEKVQNLEQQLDHVRPSAGGLDDASKEFLKLIFDAGGTLGNFALQRALGLEKSMVEHHADILSDAGMVTWIGMNPHEGIRWSLTKEGRAYVVKNLST